MAQQQQQQAASAPSSATRLCAGGYLYGLMRLVPRHSHQQQQQKATMMEVPPSAPLYLCVLCVLWVHAPALWSGRVNMDRCVAQMERLLLLVGVLQAAVLWASCGSSPLAYTCAALCVGWRVWTEVSRDWLPAPVSMKLSLVVFFAVCMPLLWAVGVPPQQQGEETEARGLLTVFFLCDTSLLCLACVQRAYGRVWELLARL